MEGKVVHFKKKPFDVYIGRPGKWGSPFEIGKDGTRKEVIEKFEKWFRASDLINDIEELRGKDLGCWCSPKKCHGDIYIKILKEKIDLRETKGYYCDFIGFTLKDEQFLSVLKENSEIFLDVKTRGYNTCNREQYMKALAQKIVGRDWPTYGASEEDSHQFFVDMKKHGLEQGYDIPDDYDHER